MNSQRPDPLMTKRPLYRRVAAYVCAACVIVGLAWRWIWPFTGPTADIMFLAVGFVGVLSALIAGLIPGRRG